MAILTEEQTMLRDSAREWVKDHAPVSALRSLRDSGNELGFDAATFKDVAAMGWTGILVPEDFGGSAFGFRGMALVLEELGRTLVAAPLVGSAVGAVTALVHGGSAAQQAQWLPGIAGGGVIAALAIDEGARHEPAAIASTAPPQGDGFVLSGTKTFVQDGMAAQVFVVAARTRASSTGLQGITLFLVPAEGPGVRRERRQLIDTRGYAEVSFDAVVLKADQVLGTLNEGGSLLERTLDSACTAAAAEAYGLALQAFEMTVDYLKTRVQFGQPIGAFQALQHRAAKMFSDFQLARGVLDAAMDAIDTDAADRAAKVSMAKAMVNDLVNLVSREMMQMHGGIGMTDEYDAGFYLKRARTLEVAWGSSAYHRERFARACGV